MNTCILCFQDINKHQDIFHWIRQDSLLCGDCLSQLEFVNTHKKYKGMDIHVLYVYNEFLENLLFQYKEGRDIALATTFLHEQLNIIHKQYKGYTLCLCPSSTIKTKERGFHALKTMCSEVKLVKLQPFYKSENRKQSLQHYEERQHINEIIHIDSNIHVSNQKLLLIDDVCTTGATLKSCYALLHPYAKDIKVLALCAHPLFLKES